MTKFLRKCVQFVSIISILSALSLFISPPYYGEKPYSTKLFYFRQNNSHFNTVIFGSSQSYRQINPQKLDLILSDYHTSTFNLATAGTGQPETYFLYEKFINTIAKSTLKYAILEISSLKYTNRKNLYSPKSYYWHNLSNLIYSIKYTLSSNFTAYRKLMYIRLYTYSYLLKLTNSFRFIFDSGQIEDPYFLGKNKDGFLAIEQELQVRPKHHSLKKRHNLLLKKPENLKNNTKLIRSYFSKSDHRNSLNPVHLNRLLHLIDISEKKGIHLFLMIPPRGHGLDELLALKEKLPLDHIIELADPRKYPELHSIEYRFDAGHFNIKGADVYSEYLGREIIARLIPTGRR